MSNNITKFGFVKRIQSRVIVKNQCSLRYANCKLVFLGCRPVPTGAQFGFFREQFENLHFGLTAVAINFQLSNKHSGSMEFTKLKTLNKQLQGTNETLADAKAKIFFYLPLILKKDFLI